MNMEYMFEAKKTEVDYLHSYSKSRIHIFGSYSFSVLKE